MGKALELLCHLARRGRSFLERVPILGGLVYCRISDHGKAIRELLVLVTFGTAAFWVSALLLFYSATQNPVTYLQALSATVGNGELFILSVSILGPAFYMAITDPYGAQRAFPEKAMYALIIIGIALVCVALFSAIKTGTIFRFRAKELVDFSIYLAVASFGLRYLAIAVNSSRLDPIGQQRDDTNDFQRMVERHREMNHGSK